VSNKLKNELVNYALKKKIKNINTLFLFLSSKIAYNRMQNVAINSDYWCLGVFQYLMWQCLLVDPVRLWSCKEAQALS